MIADMLGFGSIEQRRSESDGYISPSRLNCWLKCPLSFRLRYIEGIRTPTSPSLFLGKACHSGLRSRISPSAARRHAGSRPGRAEDARRLGQADRRGRSHV